VQIVSNLYHNFPNQRTLLVTHSNSALNDLFEKIMQRDIKERHLLRLGSGEKHLDTDKDFSKYGRVNQALARRLEMLQQVTRLATSLGVPGDFGFTCETAEYFHLYHVVSRWEAYEAALVKVRHGGGGVMCPLQSASSVYDMAPCRCSWSVLFWFFGVFFCLLFFLWGCCWKIQADKSDANVVADTFPFSAFFEDVPGGLQRLFKRADFDADYAAAKACYDHITEVFAELGSYRAFELLRTHRRRIDYLLTKEARIIAMTCTHAALTRRRLVDLRFKYDNIVMEEAAQVLEVETFIPLLLQNFDPEEGCRLKRVVLIGDHHQLPPVVKNMAFQKYGNLDQSLFARFVRLGTPTVELDLQGRARAELANLYNWRYKALGNLPEIESSQQYAVANPGCVHTFQFVDVPDFEGRGESTPQPHFYQNLGEAECVAHRRCVSSSLCVVVVVVVVVVAMWMWMWIWMCGLRCAVPVPHTVMVWPSCLNLNRWCVTHASNDGCCAVPCCAVPCCAVATDTSSPCTSTCAFSGTLPARSASSRRTMAKSTSFVTSSNAAARRSPFSASLLRCPPWTGTRVSKMTSSCSHSCAQRRWATCATFVDLS